MSRGFTPARLAAVVALGLIALGLALVIALAFGPQPISLAAALAGAEPDRAILLGLRLPRAALGALVGAALAAAGAALQALLRNPLAEPFVLGVSGGAALGGTLVLAAASAFGAGFGGALGGASATLGAFAGAAGATVLVFALGREQGRLAPQTALLVGVVFNAFAAAAITLLKLLVSPQEAARLLYWLMGSLGYEPAGTLVVASAAVAAALGVLLALSGRLNLLALGDDDAAALGVDVARTRLLVFGAASLATGAAVSLSGMVGFVGLIVPHLLRRVLGPDHRLLLPAGALFGAAFLVLADALARLAFLGLGTEAPVGAFTAALGGPAFLWLLRREARGA